MSDDAAPIPRSMRIVILGDVHTYRLWAWPWELLSKALAGQVNLWLNRRHRFDRALIAPTIERAIALKPDLTLLSGDLTTTARLGEFADAAAALQKLMDAAPAVMVPGNHDVYTLRALRQNRAARAFAEAVPRGFPFVRPLVGRWRLLAVNSAEPRLLDSRGRIGEEQLRKVEAILRTVDENEGLIVLCHYPFAKPPDLPPMKSGHRLLDDGRWRETLAACRGRLVIVHGHVHCPWLWRVEGMTNALDVNAGAPAMIGPAKRGGTAGYACASGQGFWEMELPADVSQPIAMTHHVMGAAAPPLTSGINATWEIDRTASVEGWTARAMRIDLGDSASTNAVV
jgi:3',5'-cyclic AMP phosphodiesterase CpdA